MTPRPQSQEVALFDTDVLELQDVIDRNDDIAVAAKEAAKRLDSITKAAADKL